jgi:hypothetical protein
MCNVRWRSFYEVLPLSVKVQSFIRAIYHRKIFRSLERFASRCGAVPRICVRQFVIATGGRSKINCRTRRLLYSRCSDCFERTARFAYEMMMAPRSSSVALPNESRRGRTAVHSARRIGLGDVGRPVPKRRLQDWPTPGFRQLRSQCDVCARFSKCLAPTRSKNVCNQDVSSRGPKLRCRILAGSWICKI